MIIDTLYNLIYLKSTTMKGIRRIYGPALLVPSPPVQVMVHR